MGSRVVALLLLAVPASGQQRGIDVQAYEYSVTIPDTGATILARARVRFKRLAQADDTLRLDLIGMTVDSVLESGSAARSVAFTYDNRVLEVVAASPVVVYYHGEPQDGLIIRRNARGKRAAFADNWPNRARYWLPGVDHPSDKATVTFSVVAPRGWRVVGNGTSPGCAIAGDRACVWLESRPIPTYTMVIGAGELSVSTHRPARDGARGVPIDVWAYPEDSAYADSVPFRRATEIVETMQRLVGPFPYEKLAHVESSTRFGGMENSSAIFYAEKPYVERRMGEGVVRHETAHQWFGDAVTERDWHHLWLSEGFASYFDWVIGAALDGDSVLARGMRANAERYVESSVVDRPIIDTAEHDLLKLLNENNYEKGSWVLHMLRHQVGDSAFWGGLREYYRRYRDSTALSEDFQQVMERVSRQKLAWFFGQWLYHPGYPQLDCVWAYDTVGRRLNVTVSQTQPAAWGLFRLPAVPVEITFSDGAVLRRPIALLGRTTSAAVSTSKEPTAVRIDPDADFLLRASVRHP